MVSKIMWLCRCLCPPCPAVPPLPDVQLLFGMVTIDVLLKGLTTSARNAGTSSGRLRNITLTPDSAGAPARLSG